VHVDTDAAKMLTRDERASALKIDLRRQYGEPWLAYGVHLFSEVTWATSDILSRVSLAAARLRNRMDPTPSDDRV